MASQRMDLKEGTPNLGKLQPSSTGNRSPLVQDVSACEDRVYGLSESVSRTFWYFLSWFLVLFGLVALLEPFFGDIVAKQLT